MSNTYLIGNAVRLSAVFRDFGGNPANPTTVTLSVKRVGGTLETPTAVNSAVGHYYYDYEPATAGTYNYRFAGEGAVVSATEGSFTVTPTTIV
jgi:hypothetical protein